MTSVSLAASAVMVPILSVEFTVKHEKLQTGLARVLAVWSIAFIATAVALVLSAASGLFALTIFWCGAFLAWFGVRSHIESSILLRMLCLLRAGPMTDSELVAAYASRHGESARLDELRRGGLVARNHDVLMLTNKGKAVLRIVSALR